MATLAQRMEADRRKYPALLPDEVLVLRAWLRLHELEYDTLPLWWLEREAAYPPPHPLITDRFDYNVRIGQGTDPGPSFTPNIRRDNILNTQLRLDALAFRGGVPTIIEVKRRAGPSNVGQLLTYGAAWRQEFTTRPDPHLILLCADCGSNILPIVREAGIDLQKVQVDFSPLKVPR